MRLEPSPLPRTSRRTVLGRALGSAAVHCYVGTSIGERSRNRPGKSKNEQSGKAAANFVRHVILILSCAFSAKAVTRVNQEARGMRTRAWGAVVLALLAGTACNAFAPASLGLRLRPAVAVSPAPAVSALGRYVHARSGCLESPHCRQQRAAPALIRHCLVCGQCVAASATIWGWIAAAVDGGGSGR